MFQRETRFGVVLILFVTNALFGQNQPISVELTGTLVREPINVFPGQTAVSVCGLKSGKTYQVISTPALPDQKDVFTLALTDPKQEMAARLQSPPDRPHVRRFTAAGSCAMFLLETTAFLNEMKNEVPMYLSASCIDCEDENSSLKLAKTLADAANLVVTQGNSATDLVTNVLIGGDCFDVSNIKSTGSSNSRGTFSQGQSSVNISNGVVLCTGPTSVLPGPNDLPNVNGGFGNNSSDDPHLSSLTSGNQYDVSIIEFDFKPTANMVQFDFVFGSEEYCEYVNSIYNDVFGFFISGPGINGVQNLAVLPDGTTPVTINNVNHLKNQAYYRNNNTFGTCTGLSTVGLNDIQLDGFTSVLTATANLIPCQTYHIKLAIADIGDANYTSAVFLRANSFDAGGKVLAEAVYPSPATPFTREGCGNSFIRFYRGTGDASQPLPIKYSIAPGSTAIPGVDYGALPTNIVIPAGQTEILVPIPIVNDLLSEGPEWFRLILDNSCSCDQQGVTFNIEDHAPPVVSMTDQIGCSGNAVLNPGVTGGLPPLTYQWNTGQNTPGITVSSFGSSVYTVTVSDVCGFSSTATATATVDLSPTAILSGVAQFCPGGSGTLPINFTGNGPWIVGYTANGVSQTQTFTNNPAALPVNQGGTYTLTSVVSQAGCTGLAGGSGTAQVATLSLNLTPAHPLCFGSKGSILATATSNFSPLTYHWNTGSTLPLNANQPAGFYSVTVTTPQGCTQTATTALVEPPLLTSVIGNVVNINCYTPIGSADLTAQGGTPPYKFVWSNGGQQASNVFVAGGNYAVTVTDANNCTAIASAAVAQNTTPPTVVTLVNEEITCSNPEVEISSAGSSAGGNFTYAWSTPDGNITVNPTEPNVLVDAPGTYVLLVTNTQNGCTANQQVTVSENTNYPTALDLQIVQPGCNNKPGEIQIQGVQGGDGPFVYSADGGQTFYNQTSFESLSPGQYTILVQDANGCEFQQTVTLVPPVEPEVQIVPELYLEYGQNAEIALQLNTPAELLDSIIWTPQTGISPTNRPGIFSARPFKNTLYTVTVVSKEGCRDDAQLLIRVGQPNIYAPNVFRPSSTDGVNNQFALFARESTINRISRLQVFDRWGNLVFGKDDILPNDTRAGGWDGRYKGQVLEPGVFTWWADIELAGGEHIQMKGDVTIVD